MAGFTIDEAARFVSVISFELDSGDASVLSREVRKAVEEFDPRKKGFIGSVVMLNVEKTRLLAVSVWESGHAWSAAQYDEEIGRVVADAVAAAKSYEIETFETVTVVRG